MSGYMIDWIDRPGDHGYRIIKMTNGSHDMIGHVSAPAEPGSEWRIDFSADGFTLTVDGEVQGTFNDRSYRTGYVGLWCYQNDGQDIRFDDVKVEYTGAVNDPEGGTSAEVGSGASPAPGLVGPAALSFDGGENGYVEVDGSYSPESSLSLECLVESQWSGEAGEYDTILARGDSILFAFQNDGETANRDVPLDPPSQPVLSFGLKVNGTYSELDMPLDGLDGRPTVEDLKNGIHHLCAVYDSQSGLKAIYVDGVKRFSVILTAGGAVSDGTGQTVVIGNSVDRSEPFKGTIDEAAFWNRALSDSEVARHAANSRRGNRYFFFREKKNAIERPVRFSEYFVGNAGESWIELENRGDAQVDLTGGEIVTSAGAGAGYTFPATVLEPGEFMVLTDGGLGFELAAGDKLFLYAPGKSEVVAAVSLSQSHMARSEKWGGRWCRPARATPGEENEFRFVESIVISEIMYHPRWDQDPTEEGEYLEIFNRGDEAVDLTGFGFGDGIVYTFPEGVVLGAGEYLVVARNPGFIQEKYGIGNVVGPFTGRLANGGERIELTDAAGNPVDEVRYYDRGHWPEYADGGGSSLELRDPWADNSKAQAWEASDESLKSSWKEYSYKGLALADRGPTRWNEFVMGLLDEGEILIDDISVVESPDGAAVEFLQNGSFETGAQAWRIIGNHRHSRVIEDPDDPGNHVLHLIATGSTEHMHNHAETTFTNRERVSNGRWYRISFRAKWLGGSNLLHTRLYFNRVARATRLEVPGKPGTPGGPNSTAETNIGPTYEGFSHYPVVPEAGESVSVSVNAEDPDGVARVTLWWRMNDGEWSSSTMTRDSEGFWHGSIPGQGRAAVVQFYVEGVDEKGEASYFPPRGPDSRALYKVQDGLARLGALHNVRIIMTPGDMSLLYRDTNVMSNEYLGGTVVYDEKEVFYDIGVRLKSSERGRLASTRVGFNIRFQPDKTFRGVHKSVGVDRSGGIKFGRSFGQDEILVKHIVNHAGGIPGMYDDLIRVIAPRASQTSTALLLMARFNDVFLDSQFENGGEGLLYTYELIYYPTSTVDGNPESLKRPQPDNVIAQDIQDLGTSKEYYRWFFLLENHHDRDDYRRLMEFCKKFAAPISILEESVREVMDVDEWMRTFAMYSLCGIGDTYTQGLDHNNMHYVRPSDEMVMVFPWDMDFAFVRSTTAALWGDRNLARIIMRPVFTRMFYRHLLDLIETTYNTDYMTYWINHYGSLVNQDFRSIRSYISARANYVRSRIPRGTPFEIVSHGGDDFSVDENHVLIDGNAPIEAAVLLLDDKEVEGLWLTLLEGM